MHHCSPCKNLSNATEEVRDPLKPPVTNLNSWHSWFLGFFSDDSLDKKNYIVIGILTCVNKYSFRTHRLIASIFLERYFRIRVLVSPTLRTNILSGQWVRGSESFFVKPHYDSYIAKYSLCYA